MGGAATGTGSGGDLDLEPVPRRALQLKRPNKYNGLRVGGQLTSSLLVQKILIPIWCSAANSHSCANSPLALPLHPGYTPAPSPVHHWQMPYLAPTVTSLFARRRCLEGVTRTRSRVWAFKLLLDLPSGEGRAGGGGGTMMDHIDRSRPGQSTDLRFVWGSQRIFGLFIHAAPRAPAHDFKPDSDRQCTGTAHWQARPSC